MHKKIVIICPYTEPSACGIWKRVYNDALAYKKANYKVTIFSSNIIKATSEKSPRYSNLDGIEIYRFPVILKIGGTAMFWFYQRKLLAINPDIIHTHGFRHPHSLMALILAKLIRRKIILTTHAPFLKDPRRSNYLKIMDILYDIIFSWLELRAYNLVVRVSKWEEKALIKRGCKKSVYIPNGIEKQFIDKTNTYVNSPQNRVIYMGRLDPVKRVEWLANTAKEIPSKHFVLYGPVHGYTQKQLDEWSSISNLEVIDMKYEADDFVSWVGDSDIYVLPSIRESLGITLLEAMALGKIVITADAKGPLDFVVDNLNGFVITSQKQLRDKITEIYKNWDNMHVISQNAQKKAHEFNASKLGEKLIEYVKSF